MSQQQDPESGTGLMTPHGSSDAEPPPRSTTDTAGKDPPPAYNSTFGRVRSARETSSSKLEFFRVAMLIIVNTVGCTVTVALASAIPISMVVIGSLFLEKCPREHMIPIYLIVAGAFGIVLNLLKVMDRIKARLDKDDETTIITTTSRTDALLCCFLFVWFIAGNVWIYRVYNDFNSKDPSSSEYCHPTLYWFAFWVMTGSYIFVVVACCCCGLDQSDRITRK